MNKIIQSHILFIMQYNKIWLTFNQNDVTITLGTCNVHHNCEQTSFINIAEFCCQVLRYAKLIKLFNIARLTGLHKWNWGRNRIPNETLNVKNMPPIMANSKDGQGH